MSIKSLAKYFEPIYDKSVKVSDKGVLQVDANQLLNKKSVKRQLEAVRRLERSAAPTRHRKAG